MVNGNWTQFQVVELTGLQVGRLNRATLLAIDSAIGSGGCLLDFTYRNHGHAPVLDEVNRHLLAPEVDGREAPSRPSGRTFGSSTINTILVKPKIPVRFVQEIVAT